MFTNSKI